MSPLDKQSVAAVPWDLRGLRVSFSARYSYFGFSPNVISSEREGKCEIWPVLITRDFLSHNALKEKIDRQRCLTSGLLEYSEKQEFQTW